MNDLIQRVARAIFEASDQNGESVDFASAPASVKAAACDQARAAIAAMHEPSRTMVAAGEELVVRQVSVDEAALWRAMAAAALGEAERPTD